MLEYFVRFYQKNPGGAYDPAHLAQFDIEGQPDKPLTHTTIPVPGDVIFAWSKWLCCTNPERDSSGGSSVVAGRHEQTYTANLQDQELARVQ